MERTDAGPNLKPAAEPWDGFLAGPENALAHAGVLLLAKGEVQGVSPLVVHGPGGAGKSRLLAGLVGERLRRKPESAVAHLAAEAFAAACAEANGGPGAGWGERGRGWAELRSRFRGVDLFVLDDLSSLERAPMAMDELGHTLDALAELGAGVAVAAREGPGHWLGWPRRLVGRLSGGLSVRVDPPGLPTRRRYLLEQGRAAGVNLASGAVDALAEAADGYRTIDGWLARLALGTRLGRGPLDSKAVDAFLRGDETAGAPEVDVDRVARAVAARFGLNLRDLRSSTRRQAVVGPRHLAMHLARALTGRSFARIGAYFGARDAATVRHACKMAETRLAADPALAAAAESIRLRWARGDGPAAA